MSKLWRAKASRTTFSLLLPLSLLREISPRFQPRVEFSARRRIPFHRRGDIWWPSKIVTTRSGDRVRDRYLLPPVPCVSSTGIVKKKKRIFDLFAQPSFLPQPPLQPWNSRLLFADLIVNSGFRCGSTVCWLARKERKQFGRDDKIKGIKNSARFKIYPVKNETRINGRSSIAFLHLHFPATFVNNIYLILSVSIIIILSLVVGRRSRELDKIIIVGGENRMTR